MAAESVSMRPASEIRAGDRAIGPTITSTAMSAVISAKAPFRQRRPACAFTPW